MERGVALSRQYGVDLLLQPIFDYVPTADSPPLAPKHITAPPARPKKKDLNGDGDGGQHKTARVQATKAAAAKKRELEARRAAEERAREESEEEANAAMAAMGSDGRSLSPTPSEASDSSETPSPLGSENGDFEYHELNSMGPHGGMGGSNGAHVNGEGGGGGGGARKRKHQEMGTMPQGPTGPLRYARMILDYFVSEATSIPQFLVSPPADFDANVVIDDDGHTALHWACAMGRIRIVKLLLSAGADIFRANSMGQTALMRSVMFTNNYDLRKFPELFELLHRSTINIDRNDRTVFHYIVDIALQKGKTHAARYYIETVLARLVDYPKEVADILNFQDEEGETALTLAARARSKRLVKILLDNGGDPKITNRDGKSAEDYILEDERFRESELGPTSISIQPPPGPLPLQYQSQSHPSSHDHEHHSLPQSVPLTSSFSLPIPNSHLPRQDHSQSPPRQSHLGPPLPLPSSSSSTSNPTPTQFEALAALLPQTLYTSSTALRTATHALPEMVSLLTSLATSFDSALISTSLDQTQALTLLANLQSEIFETDKVVGGLLAKERDLLDLAHVGGGGSEALEERERELLMCLENKIGKRFRLGWEKWVRDEDTRENEYLLRLGGGGKEEDLEFLRELAAKDVTVESIQLAKETRTRVGKLIEERKDLFGKLARLQSGVGTGTKMKQYRQLIALGCGVGLEQVDGIIETLIETLDGRNEGEGY